MPTKETNTQSLREILFLGDCNTLGTSEIEGSAYPEKLAAKLNTHAINCGHTMCTIREGREYFNRFYSKNVDLVCLQYGLVDSWRTFIYSPYVLYYPDSAKRKIGRKLTKKFKKWCKKLGLNELMGTKNVVPASEFARQISFIAETVQPKPLVLIETVPNKESYRNPEIQRYNKIMHDIASRQKNCSVLAIYSDFDTDMSSHYLDNTHIDSVGHEFVATKLSEHIQTILGS